MFLSLSSSIFGSGSFSFLKQMGENCGKKCTHIEVVVAIVFLYKLWLIDHGLERKMDSEYWIVMKKKERDRGGGNIHVVWRGLFIKEVGMPLQQRGRFWATNSCGLWDHCVLLDSLTLLIKIYSAVFCPTLFHPCHLLPLCYSNSSSLFFYLFLVVSQITSQPFIFYLNY